MFDVVPEDMAPTKKTRIVEHERASGNRNKNLIDGNDDAALFLDESKVPVEVIDVANDEGAGLDRADFEVISENDYFVEVLQRVGQRPASLVRQLTPRIWKEMFAANPLRSHLRDLGGRRTYVAA